MLHVICLYAASLAFQHMLDASSNLRQHAWAGLEAHSLRVPGHFLAETALSNSVCRLQGRAHTSFHTNAFSSSHGGPASASAHLINPHGNKGKQPRPSMRRPALPCCWHGVCGRWTTGRKEGASFAEGNCVGAKRCAFVIGGFFFLPSSFFFSSLPSALLKPCLDLFTQWLELHWQGGGCSSDKHKHVNSGQQRPLTSFAGYLPTGRLLVTRPGTKNTNNMSLVTAGVSLLSKRKSEN